MAAFKVGQRVRIVNFSGYANGREAVITGIVQSPSWFGPIERCGIIPREDGYELDVDGMGSVDKNGVRYGLPARFLAPLTDPGADAFLARIKKLGSEPVNDAPKVTVREGE